MTGVQTCALPISRSTSDYFSDAFAPIQHRYRSCIGSAGASFHQQGHLNARWLPQRRLGGLEQGESLQPCNYLTCAHSRFLVRQPRASFSRSRRTRSVDRDALCAELSALYIGRSQLPCCTSFEEEYIFPNPHFFRLWQGVSRFAEAADGHQKALDALPIRW